MNIITVGIDLAKNVFAVHGVNESGKPELVKPKVPRDQLLPLIATLPDRHGSLHRRSVNSAQPQAGCGLPTFGASLGTLVYAVRPHRSFNCPQVCYALPHDR